MRGVPVLSKVRDACFHTGANTTRFLNVSLLGVQLNAYIRVRGGLCMTLKDDLAGLDLVYQLKSVHRFGQDVL